MTDLSMGLEAFAQTVAAKAADLAAHRVLSELTPHLRRSPDRPPITYMTNPEAQKVLGVSRATLARWRKDGTIPYSKLGRSVYYAVEDVEVLLASRQIRSAA